MHSFERLVRKDVHADKRPQGAGGIFLAADKKDGMQELAEYGFGKRTEEVGGRLWTIGMPWQQERQELQAIRVRYRNAGRFVQKTTVLR